MYVPYKFQPGLSTLFTTKSFTYEVLQYLTKRAFSAGFRGEKPMSLH